MGAMDEGIRPATLDDKESVLRIHDNVYDGRDYLQDLYDYLVTAPHCKAFVFEVDGIIVGFITSFIVDGGDTVVSRAGRMNPHFSKRGRYQELKMHALKASAAHVNAFTSNDANENIFTKSFQEKNKMILVKPMTRYLIDPVAISLIETSPGHANIPRIFTDTDMEQYITDKVYSTYLFPHNRVIVDWVPFKLMSSNIPLLRATQDMTVIFTDVNVDERSATGLLSFGTIFSCRNPRYAYNIDIYGTDISSLKWHVLAHIQVMKDKASAGISLLVFVEKTFDPKAVEHVFNEIGLFASEWRDSSNPKLKYSCQTLFENPI